VNFNSKKNPLSNKYLTHGRRVPIHKCYNLIHKKSYSTHSTRFSEKNSSAVNKEKKKDVLSTEINIVKLYENDTFKKQIIDENNNKSGIYLITNLLNQKSYLGQSTDLGKRFRNYLTLSYLKNRNSLVINRDLIKYGYVHFSISILEYCDKTILNEREQHYMDIIKPVYNTLKIANSSSGYKHTQESKDKRSLSLKGKYTGILSALYGTQHTDATKQLMRQKPLGRKDSSSTLDKMSRVKGNSIEIYEKCNKEGFKYIGHFISPRRAGLFLGISGTRIIQYMRSGQIFKDKYIFKGKATSRSPALVGLWGNE